MDPGVILGIIGVALSSIALVLSLMALLLVFQMFWGRPELRLAADEFTGSEGKILLIQVKNLPTGKWGRRLGVERQTGQVQASFDIQEQGSKKFIVKSVPGLIQCPPIRESGLLMQALPGFTIGVVVLGFGKNASGKEMPGIVDVRAGEITIPINEGHYTVYVHVFCGEQIYNFRKDLKVGSKPHQTFWC
jgi:hypothetical protein